MKRLRISRCTAGQLLNAQAGAHASPYLTPISFRAPRHAPRRSSSFWSAFQSKKDAKETPETTETPVKSEDAAEKAVAEEDAAKEEAAKEDEAEVSEPVEEQTVTEPTHYPSPLPEKAQTSAKLAALHARLSLPAKLPLETLARCLVDPSADPSPNFNNANLAVVGGSLLTYHTSEWLLCHYPRLPMSILYEAMRAYAGSDSLFRVANQWGVESAAFPGSEVDPGLLQWSQDPTSGVVHGRWGYVRKEHRHLDKFKWRRGMSSRIVLDDDFGDAVHQPEENPENPAPDAHDPDAVRERYNKLRNNAHAAFLRAVAGALYAHCGLDAVRSFVDAHVLSRRVDLEKLFSFKLPVRELTMLCAREGFEPPVARVESETGRLSRTPVFVVGIYSGTDKLGEGTGASLDFARLQAAMNALKSWYLYSPGPNVRVPSDMLARSQKAPWQPVHIDMGEII